MTRNRLRLSEEEWNFKSVPESQKRSCLLYELARESQTLRLTIDKLKQDQDGQDVVPKSASSTKLSSEDFYFYFRSLLAYFPKIPWRHIPLDLTKGYSEEGGLIVGSEGPIEVNPFSVVIDLEKPLTHEEFMAYEEPGIQPIRAFINWHFSNKAIKNCFAAWLEREMKRRLERGISIKEPISMPGIKEVKGAGPKPKAHTNLKQLSIMRLMHHMPLPEAMCEAKRMNAEFGCDQDSREQWYVERRKTASLLKKYFSEVPPNEKPINYPTFRSSSTV